MPTGRRSFLAAFFSAFIASIIACGPRRQTLPSPIEAGQQPPLIPTLPPLSSTPSLSPTPTLTPTATGTSTIPETTAPPPMATLTRAPSGAQPAANTNTPRPTDIPAATLAPTAVPPDITLSPTPTLVPIPDMIVPRSGWGAAAPSGPGLPNVPSRLTVHHDGVEFGPTDDPVQRLQTVQRYSMQTQGWIDTPYHFILDPAGRIYEARYLYYQVDTGTTYDTAGHVGLSLIGDYNVQQPSAAMIDSLARLLAWVSASYAISLDTLTGHRDVASTSCPGDNVYNGYIANGLLRSMAASYLP